MPDSEHLHNLDKKRREIVAELPLPREQSNPGSTQIIPIMWAHRLTVRYAVVQRGFQDTDQRQSLQCEASSRCIARITTVKTEEAVFACAI
jgi:hypothetical protein